MDTKTSGKIIFIIFSALIIFLFSMCEDFQEETLKPEKTDAYAIEVFKDTNIVEIPVGHVITDAEANTYTVKAGDSTFDCGSTYSLVMGHLLDSNITVETGTTHYQVAINKNRENALLLSVSGDKEIVVYTSHFVDVNILDNTKTAMDVDRAHQTELVSGCFTYDEARDEFPLPIVKSRSSFELSSGQYVLNINATEATKETTFSLVVVEKQ